MATHSFADVYRSAMLAPGPEIIRLRQEVLDELRRKLKFWQIIDLVGRIIKAYSLLDK